MDSKIPYEFRTTFAKPLLSVADIEGIGKMIQGADKYIIQNYLKTKQVDEAMELQPFSGKDLLELKKAVSSFVKKVELR